MKTITETLIDLSNKTNTKVTYQELANVLGYTKQYISQIKNQVLTPKQQTKIENHYNISLTKSSNLDSDCVEIEHIHINPSCGTGTVVIDEPEITPIKLGKKLIETILRVTDVKNLKTFTASGDSMSDTIDDGNLLLVDTGRKDFNNGGIFILQKDDEWFVKRLQLRFSGELDIISDNPKYRTDTITPNDEINVIIRGRVIKNLSKGL